MMEGWTGRGDGDGGEVKPQSAQWIHAIDDQDPQRPDVSCAKTNVTEG